MTSRLAICWLHYYQTAQTDGIVRFTHADSKGRMRRICRFVDEQVEASPRFTLVLERALSACLTYFRPFFIAQKHPQQSKIRKSRQCAGYLQIQHNTLVMGHKWWLRGIMFGWEHLFFPPHSFCLQLRDFPCMSWNQMRGRSKTWNPTTYNAHITVWTRGANSTC